VITVLACPLFLGLAALAPLLVPAVFGVAWLDAVPIVQLLMLVGIRYSLSMIQAAVIRGMGKPHLDMIAAAASVAIAAAMIYLAVPYGLVPATAAFLISGMLAFPLQAMFVNRLIGLTLTEQTTALGRVGIAGCVMAGTLLAVTPTLSAYLSPIAAMAVLIPLGAVLYWAMLKVVMPAAAAVIEHILVSMARRDFGAVRASLGGMSA
jgi:O-antigen/teichoic acid export membrane protein